MLDAIIAGAVVLVLIVGFWWTRGAGNLIHRIDEPARQEMRKFDEIGNRLPDPGDEP